MEGEYLPKTEFRQGSVRKGVVFLWRKPLALALILAAAAAISQNVLASGIFVTYTNESYRFTMDYPERWTARRDVGPAIVVMFLSSLEGADDKFMENVNVVVEDLEEETPLDRYTDASVEQIRQSISEAEILSVRYAPSAPLPYSDIVFAGRQGQFRLKWLSRTVMVGKRAFLLTYTAEVDSFDRYLADATATFSSFRIY